MSVIGSNIIAGASGVVADTGYQIARSLRFNSADSAYLNRTPGSAGNRRTWTVAGWFKKNALSTGTLFSARNGTTGDSFFAMRFESADTLNIFEYSGTAFNWQLQTTQVFRDLGAWMHIVLAVDTTQATASNRAKLYINGVQVTALSASSYPSQNYDCYVNNAFAHSFGASNRTSIQEYLNHYLADVRFIDGQALTPSDFGQTDSATGVWVPKAYTGTFGTNGFWLKFDDNSGVTATTLGKDSSGNSNNWTPNNFSVTAGVGNDSLVDSPTNYGTDTGAGGEVRGNYATMNPLDMGSQVSLANGNLDVSWSNTAGHSVRATTGITTGKWYWEVVAGGNCSIGIILGDLRIVPATGSLWPGADGFGAGGSYAYAQDGRAVTNSVYSTYGASFASGDVIGVAFDADNGKIFFAKNGTWQNSGNPASGTNPAYSSIASNTWMPAIGYWGGTAGTVNTFNFGQRPFAYTAPSGFKALCTQNLPTPTIGTSSTNLADDYFNVVTYTGTGSSLSITGVGFQPDLVWIKGRSGATDHALYDAVRGVQKQLESNTTTDETTESTGLTAFGTDGFTVGALAQLNTNAATYVGWNWKESATSGFDIVTYTGNGANRTIAHNLGVAPKMLIVKARTTAGTDTGWPVWHTGIANTNYLELHATTASTSGTTYWNSTSPTSSVFSVGTAAAVNTNNDTYVAYLFAEVTGFSKIGTYTGNGNADGPFVYCGFRPKFVMSKNASSAVQGWTIQNPANQNYNEINNYVFAQSANAETGGFAQVDFLSNGFKIRTSDTLVNGNTNNIIFIAFAENPFNYSRAR